LVGKFEIRKTTFFKCDGMVGHCKGWNYWRQDKVFRK
jgi:hypothetical protein